MARHTCGECRWREKWHGACMCGESRCFGSPRYEVQPSCSRFENGRPFVSSWAGAHDCLTTDGKRGKEKGDG